MYTSARATRLRYLQNVSSSSWKFTILIIPCHITFRFPGDATVSLLGYCQTIDSNGKVAKAQSEDDKEEDGEGEEENESFFGSLDEDDNEYEKGSTSF